MTAKTIGERIKQKRKNKCYSQEKLANLIGVTDGAISKFERNESIPSTLTLMCLADVFKCSVDELLGRAQK